MPSDEATPELDLWSYVRILGRRKWWIIIMTVVGLVAGAAYVYVSPKKYSATSLLQVEPTTGNLSVSGPTPTVAPTTVST